MESLKNNQKTVKSEITEELRKNDPSTNDAVQELNLSPLQLFFETELDPGECSRSLSTIIEFTSVLIMVSSEGEDTAKDLWEAVSPSQAYSAYLVNIMAQKFAMMRDNTDLSDITLMFKQVEDPLDVSQQLMELALRINMLLVLIASSQSDETARKFKEVMRKEYYDALRHLTHLSDIFREISILNKKY